MARHLRRKVLGSSAVIALLAALGIAIAPPAGAAPVADVGELRTAFNTANNSDGADDTIELLPGATYLIEDGDSVECDDDPEAPDEDDNDHGDLDHLDLEGDLTIFTPEGQPPATIEMGCPNQRVIEHGTGGEPGETGTLTLRNVRIVGGDAKAGGDDPGGGGGVYAETGDVVVENSEFSANSGGDGADGILGDEDGEDGGFGGAILMGLPDEFSEGAGDLTVTDSSFVANTAGRGGNAVTGLCIANPGFPGCNGNNGGDGGFGGAILSVGNVEITRSSFVDNRAGAGGNGSSGTDGNPELVVTPANQGASELTPDESTAEESAPALAAESEAVSASPAAEEGDVGVAATEGGFGGDGGDGGGGGALAIIGQLTIVESTFADNAAGVGGNGGNGGNGGTDVDDGNTPAQVAGEGGSGGSGGQGGHGGAIVLVEFEEETPDHTITNSTLDDNDAGDGGDGGNGGNAGEETGAPGGAGGRAGDGGCAAVAEFIDDLSGCRLLKDQQVGDVTLLLTHVTLTDSDGGDAGEPGEPGTGDPDAGDPGDEGDAGGGGILASDWGADGSVIGTTRPTDGATIQALGNDCWIPAADSAYSVDTDGSCEFDTSTDLGAGNFLDFQLGALADNGGPTQTRLPGGAGLLANVVPPADLVVSQDQRGVPRPQEGAGEIGAVEILPPLTIAVTKTASAASVPVNTQVVFTFTVKNASANTPKAGVTIVDPNCSNITSPTGDADVDTILDPDETWTYTCTATPTTVGDYTNTVTATVTDVLENQVTGTASVTVKVTEAPAGGGLARSGAYSMRLAFIGFGLVLIGALVLSRRPQLPFVRTGWRDSGKGRHLP